MGMQYVWTLASALALAGAAVLQHHEARRQPDHLAFSPRLLGRLATRPLWVVGTGVELVGVGAQALALRAGPVTTVQVLKTSSVVFALVLASQWHPIPLRRTDVAYMALLAAALSTFLIVARPVTSRPSGEARGWFASAGVVVVVVGCALAVSRVRAGSARSIALGVATGAVWALTAVLLKAAVAAFESHGARALGTWSPWTLTVAGLIGTVLNQTAFQSGNLAWSLPAMSVVEPLLGTVCGAIVFGERLRAHGLASWSVLALSVAGAVTSIALLAHREASARGRIGTDRCSDVE